METLVHTLTRLPAIGFMFGRDFYSLNKFPRELTVRMIYDPKDSDMILSCHEVMVGDIWYSARTLEPLSVQKVGGGSIKPLLDYIEDNVELQMGLTKKTPLSVKQSGARGR